MAVHSDILIVPSKLNAFVKEVCGSLVVSPGGLTKNTTSGTFAVLDDVHPAKDEVIATSVEEKLESGIIARIRVDIKHI